MKFYGVGDGFVGFAVDDQGPGYIFRVLDGELAGDGDEEGVGGEAAGIGVEDAEPAKVGEFVELDEQVG